MHKYLQKERRKDGREEGRVHVQCSTVYLVFAVLFELTDLCKQLSVARIHDGLDVLDHALVLLRDAILKMRVLYPHVCMYVANVLAIIASNFCLSECIL